MAAFEWRMEFMIYDALLVRVSRLKILQRLPDRELPNLRIVP